MMAISFEITGNVRDRFIQAAALLRLLDPVRGEPTAYSLDQDSSTVEGQRELLLKRKFLDSFALICAVKKGGDSVSVACLEEGQPEGTVVRIASNAGVSDGTIISLRNILGLLQKISLRELESTIGEQAVLLEIVQLDLLKIREYIRTLKTSRNVFDEPVAALRSRLLNVPSDSTLSPIQHFLDWFAQIFSIKDLPKEPAPGVLLGYIVWAREAKKLYYRFLKLAFASSDDSLPRWIQIVFKLGRYGIAARAFVQTSLELPALFDPMVVESVAAPDKAPYSIRGDDMPLSCMLRRVPGIKPDEAIPRLASVWNTNQPESFFRDSCSVDLVTHAEIQMVNFYDHNPDQRPRLKFIGVSKKSCYLCSQFLQMHPSKFLVSSCHQKLYLSWIPAPATDRKVYNKIRNITVEMSKSMEAIAREELAGRLGSKRLAPADSTAGVSLSGLTEWSHIEVIDFAERNRIEEDGFTSHEEVTDFAERNRIEEDGFTSHEEFADSDISPLPVALQRPLVALRPSSVSEMALSSATRQSIVEGSARSVSSMVFHFKLQGDETRQDIIMVDSILDPHTHHPSWSKLVELLNADDNFGLVFKDSHVLFFNDKIRVRNERQFIACLQFLLNQGTWNSEVMVCDSGSSASISTGQNNAREVESG